MAKSVFCLASFSLPLKIGIDTGASVAILATATRSSGNVDLSHFNHYTFLLVNFIYSKALGLMRHVNRYHHLAGLNQLVLAEHRQVDCDDDKSCEDCHDDQNRRLQF